MKKSFKRVFSLLLVVFLMASVIPGTYAAETEPTEPTTEAKADPSDTTTEPTDPSVDPSIPEEPTETTAPADDTPNGGVPEGGSTPAESLPGESDPAETDPATTPTTEPATEPATEPTSGTPTVPQETEPQNTTPTTPAETEPVETETEETEPENTGISAEDYLISPGDILYPHWYSPLTRATGSSITVLSEPEWIFTSNPIYYNRYDKISGYNYPLVYNFGSYWVNNFSYFNLSNGQIGYCIQPYFEGATGTFTPVEWQDFSAARQNGVAKALIYGAPNNGDTSGDAYLATAALVRDMAMGYRNEYGQIGVYKDMSNGEMITQSPFGNRLASSYPAAYALYQEYIAAIQNHGKRPSFSADITASAPTYELQPDGSGNYTLTLTDTNGVLAKHFHFSCNVTGVTFTQNGNSLTITATPAAAAQLANGVLVSSNLAYDYASPETAVTVWRKSADSQKIAVLNVATDPAAAYFKLTARANGELKIDKATTNGGSLAGWTFKVTKADGSLVGTYTSDSTGTISLSLPAGTYIVTETNSGSEYWVNDPSASRTITIEAGKTTTVTFTNQWKGKLSIKKEMTTDGPLDGWQFKITRVADGAEIGTFTTDANGEFLSDLLEPVQYKVEEIFEENSLYYCKSENPVTVTITAGQTATVTFSNALRPGKITVEKVNYAGEHLADAKFLLEWSNDNGATWAPVFYSETEDVVMGGCNNENIVDGCVTTDSTGIIEFGNLHPSLLYRLTEIEAPDGYSLLTEPIFSGKLPVDTLEATYKVTNSTIFSLPHSGTTTARDMVVSGALLIGCVLASMAMGVFVSLYNQKKALNKPEHISRKDANE